MNDGPNKLPLLRSELGVLEMRSMRSGLTVAQRLRSLANQSILNSIIVLPLVENVLKINCLLLSKLILLT